MGQNEQTFRNDNLMLLESQKYIQA